MKTTKPVGDVWSAAPEVAAVWKAIGGTSIRLSPVLIARFREWLSTSKQEAIAEGVAALVGHALYRQAVAVSRGAEWWGASIADLCAELACSEQQFVRRRAVVGVRLGADRRQKRDTVSLQLLQYRQVGRGAATEYSVDVARFRAWIESGNAHQFALPLEGDRAPARIRDPKAVALDHAPAAVRAMHAATSIIPDGATWEELNSVIGDDPDAVEVWSIVCADRIRRGAFVKNIGEGVREYQAMKLFVDAARVDALRRMRTAVAARLGVRRDTVTTEQVNELIERDSNQLSADTRSAGVTEMMKAIAFAYGV